MGGLGLKWGGWFWGSAVRWGWRRGVNFRIAGVGLKLDDSTPSRTIMRVRTGSSRVLAASLLNKARSKLGQAVE